MASDVSDKSGETGVRARVILQQCLSARLMVQPTPDTEEAQYVQVGRGLIVYVCFMKGADESILEKMVKNILGARLSENEVGKLVSVTDLPGDVLIIPQATLGGSLKGKMMQYHRNIDKTRGLQLYTKLVEMCTQTVIGAGGCASGSQKPVVRHGTYGNRQVFSTETNGPFTHILEF